MLHDLRSPFPQDIDYGNVYVTLEEAMQLTAWSHTQIRMLVNEGFLPQKQRGLYRIHDLMQAIGDYYDAKRNGLA